MRNRKVLILFYAIALFLGIAAIVFSYTGLPGNLDTEPLLGIGLLCLGTAGIMQTRR